MNLQCCLGCFLSQNCGEPFYSSRHWDCSFHSSIPDGVHFTPPASTHMTCHPYGGFSSLKWIHRSWLCYNALYHTIHYAPFQTIPTTRYYFCTALPLYCRYNPLMVGPSLYCFSVLSVEGQNRINRTPGETLEQFLTTSLFEPLGMYDTSFSVPDEKLHRFAACYGNASTWGRLYGSISGKAPKVSRNGLVRLDGDCPEDSAWRRGQDCKIQLHLFASKCFVFFGFFHSYLLLQKSLRSA